MHHTQTQKVALSEKCKFVSRSRSNKRANTPKVAELFDKFYVTRSGSKGCLTVLKVIPDNSVLESSGSGTERSLHMSAPSSTSPVRQIVRLSSEIRSESDES